MLLKDQKSHEEICIQKYNNYANQVQDPELKQLFNGLVDRCKTIFSVINCCIYIIFK